jgi:hypothetical protein
MARRCGTECQLVRKTDPTPRHPPFSKMVPSEAEPEGGRKKGWRNRLGEDFIAALADDFAKHGAAAIERVRQEKPSGYIKVVASLLPRDVNLNVRPLDDLSDEQLLERLRSLTKQAAPLLANLDGDDETEVSRH